MRISCTRRFSCWRFFVFGGLVFVFLFVLPSSAIPRKNLTCGLCEEPIDSGKYIRLSKGKTYHKECYDRVPKCGLTGQPITPGTGYVRIGDETYLKSAYDKSKKCLVSGLPISNNGKYLKNSRTGTYVLKKFIDKTRQCYSCGDHLNEGYQAENDLFLCSYCYEKGVRDDGDARPHINTVIDFFRKRGLTVPENIEIRIIPPGRLIDEDQPELKGRCRPHCVSRNEDPGSLSYTIEFLWGLNPDVFVRVAAHELAHTVIGSALISRKTCEKPDIPYEEGRCEYAAYKFSKSKGLPEYIIDKFGENQMDNYREEFLYVRSNPPDNLRELLTSVDF